MTSAHKLSMNDRLDPDAQLLYIHTLQHYFPDGTALAPCDMEALLILHDHFMAFHVDLARWDEPGFVRREAGVSAVSGRALVVWRIPIKRR